MNTKMHSTFQVIVFLIHIVVYTREEVIEDFSRSFTFAAVVNTSSSLDSEDQILARHQARSTVHCAHKCLTNKQCQVIGFNAKSGVCWLMKSAGRNGLWESQDNLILIKVEDEDKKIPKSPVVETFSSCKEVLEKGRSKGNGFYNIKTDRASTTKTYCHMDQLPDCGGGGWTLTMKIDGSKNTFNYKSSYWTNKQPLKTENGLGLENKETKLPTYWSIPLTKICLGMKTRTAITNWKWLKLELKQRAASLYDVITTGYPAQPYTLLGVNKWKNNFFPRKYLSGSLFYEGVSLSLTSGSKVRLGVISKVMKYPNAQWRDSILGFGMWNGLNGGVSCGKGGSKELATDEPAFCYILTH